MGSGSAPLNFIVSKTLVPLLSVYCPLRGWLHLSTAPLTFLPYYIPTPKLIGASN